MCTLKILKKLHLHKELKNVIPSILLDYETRNFTNYYFEN